MNTKKTVLVLFALVIGVSSAYAACPSLTGPYTSKHHEYLCKRYLTITHGTARRRIDLQQVQMVFDNTYNYAKHVLSPAPPWGAVATDVYVVFNNGTWMVFADPTSSPKPFDAWDAYRDFLIENPSFIGMR